MHVQMAATLIAAIAQSDAHRGRDHLCRARHPETAELSGPRAGRVGHLPSALYGDPRNRWRHPGRDRTPDATGCLPALGRIGGGLLVDACAAKPVSHGQWRGSHGALLLRFPLYRGRRAGALELGRAPEAGTILRVTTINPEELLLAYRLGIFPMAESRAADEVLSVRPHERGILPL